MASCGLSSTMPCHRALIPAVNCGSVSVGMVLVCGSVPGSTLGELDGDCGNCGVDGCAGVESGADAVPGALLASAPDDDAAADAALGLDEELPQPAAASIRAADATAHSTVRVLIGFNRSRPHAIADHDRPQAPGTPATWPPRIRAPRVGPS